MSAPCEVCGILMVFRKKLCLRCWRWATAILRDSMLKVRRGN